MRVSSGVRDGLTMSAASALTVGIVVAATRGGSAAKMGLITAGVGVLGLALAGVASLAGREVNDAKRGFAETAATTTTTTTPPRSGTTTTTTRPPVIAPRPTPPTTTTTTTPRPPSATTTTAPPKPNIPETWATGPLVQMRYVLRAIQPFYDGGTSTAHPVAASNPATRVGASFNDAVSAAKRLASQTTEFNGMKSSGSAAVLQARDGTYFVTKLVVRADGKEGSPPVDGSARKLFIKKDFDNVVTSFTITKGVEGLRAIVGSEGYWRVNAAGEGAGYVQVR